MSEGSTDTTMWTEAGEGGGEKKWKRWVRAWLYQGPSPVISPDSIPLHPHSCDNQHNPPAPPSVRHLTRLGQSQPCSWERGRSL